MGKFQRTGLTEGSLIYNEWLKKFGLYREDTEAEFINWLYSTSGWYDQDISGSYFDIDVEAVKASDNYQRFLTEYRDSLKNSEWFHLMVHSSYHLNGLEKAIEFSNQFSPTNLYYWRDKDFMLRHTSGKRILVISSIAPLITQKYGVMGYKTPQNHFNKGDYRNAWETLDKVTKDIEKVLPGFDFAIVSFGAYGCLLTDRIWKMGKDAATVGSGIYDLFPVGEIPREYRPPDYQKIEDGRYWLQK